MSGTSDRGKRLDVVAPDPRLNPLKGRRIKQVGNRTIQFRLPDVTRYPIAFSPMNDTAVHELVRDYYGSELTSSADLRTSACCDPESVPESLKPLLAKVHPQVMERYYGCGLVAPELLSGRRVLDLGCGAGCDVYLLSQLVGEHGHVIGVDMTEEQLAVARAQEEYHREAFGYERSNVTLLHGYIERLEDLDIEPGSIDVIVSNCVINLSPDKAAVLRGAQRLLAPGGERATLGLRTVLVRRPNFA